MYIYIYIYIYTYIYIHIYIPVSPLLRPAAPPPANGRRHIRGALSRIYI